MNDKLSVGDRIHFDDITSHFDKQIRDGSTSHVRENNKKDAGTVLYKHTFGVGRWHLPFGIGSRAQRIRKERQAKRERGFQRVHASIVNQYDDRLGKGMGEIIAKKVFTDVFGENYDARSGVTFKQMRAVKVLVDVHARRVELARKAQPLAPVHVPDLNVETSLDTKPFADRVYNAAQNNKKLVKNDKEFRKSAYDAYLAINDVKPLEDNEPNISLMNTAVDVMTKIPRPGHDVEVHFMSHDWYSSGDETISTGAKRLKDIEQAASGAEIEKAKSALNAKYKDDRNHPAQSIGSIHFTDNSVGAANYRIYLDVEPTQRAKVLDALAPRLFSHDPNAPDADGKAKLRELKIMPVDREGTDGLVINLRIPDGVDPIEASRHILTDIAAVQQDPDLAQAFRGRNEAPRLNLATENNEPALVGVSMLPSNIPGAKGRESAGSGAARYATEIYKQLHTDNKGQVERETFADAVDQKIKALMQETRLIRD